MEPYHKIQTLLKRDPATNHKTVLVGEYALPEFEYLERNQWIFTEKVDGMNIRIMQLPSGDIVLGGKTDNAQLPAKLVQRLSELFPSHNKLHEQFPDGACLYGEGFGAGIQKGGGNYQATQEFVLFDICVGNWWLQRDTVVEIADALDIRVVPIIRSGTPRDAIRFVSHGFASDWGDFQAEGIVLRPTIEFFDRSGKRIIAKLKCKDFHGT